jgi:hypothetical protein
MSGYPFVESHETAMLGDEVVQQDGVTLEAARCLTIHDTETEKARGARLSGCLK